MINYDSLVENAIADGAFRHVVGAVAIERGRVLLLQRRADDFMGGLYGPSGEVLANEPLLGALKREVEEETGCHIHEVVSHLGNFDYQAKSGNKTRQFTFLVRFASAENIRLQEHDSHVWVSPQDIDQYHVSKEVRTLLDNLWISKSDT